MQVQTSANIVVVPCKRTQQVTTLLSPTMLGAVGHQCWVRLHGPFASEKCLLVVQLKPTTRPFYPLDKVIHPSYNWDLSSLPSPSCMLKATQCSLEYRWGEENCMPGFMLVGALSLVSKWPDFEVAKIYTKLYYKLIAVFKPRIQGKLADISEKYGPCRVKWQSTGHISHPRYTPKKSGIYRKFKSSVRVSMFRELHCFPINLQKTMLQWLTDKFQHIFGDLS